jgi:CheY-like chemotaxis protein
MPDMDGHELLRCIRALPSNRARQTRAIALTAYAGADDRARAIAASYDLHLAKPFAPGELVEAVLDLAGRDSL